MPRPLVPLLCLFCAVVSCPAAVVLNEVHYDPPGADGGAEFVELFNAGSAPVPLEGWTLEFANGAVGPVWSVRWRGGVEEVLAPGGFHLVVDRGWTGPAPDAVVSLGLQNGPDALRLRAPDGTTDLLGWGALEYAELSEGTPHPGAGGGLALARRPDGADSDRNFEDWTTAEPTPGVPNFPRFAAVVVEVAWEPPSLEGPGDTVEVRALVRNLGLDALPGGGVALIVGGETAAMASAGALPPTDEGELVWLWRPGTVGDFAPSLSWNVDAGALDLPLGRYRVGPPALRITEVAAAPRPGGSEWIELTAAGDVALELSDYALADEGGAPHELPARVLAPGERVVLAQDREALLDERRGLEAAGAPGECAAVDLALFVLEIPDGWPTLNNTPSGEAPFAERLRLLCDDQVVETAAIGGAGVEVLVGRSVERTGLAPGLATPWGVCTDPSGGTPACLNSLERGAAVGGALHLEPNPWDPLADPGLAVAFDVPAGATGWRLEVYDLWGQRRRDLGGDRFGPGARHRVWNGCDDRGTPLDSGAYVLVLTLSDAGGVLARRKALLAVRAGGRP